ncbi:class I SAM-dependent methyltransferase [Streptomyces sp. MP131-18]|uniref:class I SAM-dependent methyltransferase n=1 Tax=Streptomyces sp. MP131-18 TaxID=1857892 RepID=UPI00097C6BAA|nr:class I SAM-dependent methyltransferase [Streptomyces sp. MP131-18]ONK15976.1 Malonyl-CoA O-methyltransferase BioC [Streptomyces sp. MP131-18]
MIHEDPLAYALGLQGMALMRSFTGEHDRAFVAERLAEIRALLDDASLVDAGVDVARVGTVEGYRVWSETYDDVPNTAFDYDEPLVTEIVGALPSGVALDAACGTGRFAAALAARGHRVLGVDSSPDMLRRARLRVPEGTFLDGDLDRMPVEDAAVDLVVCGLALEHVPDLGPVFAEFARVLRPGGQLVISDIHPEQVALGRVPSVRTADGRRGRIASYRHATGDYLRAALAAGLDVRRCEEPLLPAVVRTEPAEEAPEPAGPGPWHAWPWSLAALAPEAAEAAQTGRPAMLIWQFQRPPAAR